MAGDLIVITGATGQQGGATARVLLQAGRKVRAVTRKPQSPAALALAALGAEVVTGDLNDAASLAAALRGAWGVYGVQNTWEAGVEQEEIQGKRLVQVAGDAGIRHFVYASVASAHRRTGIPHFDNKARVEDALRASGIPSRVIIRPVFFMDNLLGGWFKPALDTGVLAMGIKPGTALQMVAVTDIGAYGALAFIRAAELNGSEIDIAGDELTMPQAAEVLTLAAGRTIRHLQVPIEDVRKASEDYALMLEWFDAVGYNVDIAGNQRIYGIAPTRFADWAKKQDW
jgi:uncharacterized protein YbjT (DUF2867 family)